MKSCVHITCQNIFAVKTSFHFPGIKNKDWALLQNSVLLQCCTNTLLPSQKVEGLDKNFGDNDYGIATERQCMERAPSDNQERCAFVKHNHKQVYMCFCKGDLCNAGHLHAPSFTLALLAVMTGLALQIFLWHFSHLKTFVVIFPASYGNDISLYKNSV